MLEIKNLNKSFDKKPILKDINLSLKKGEVLSILGNSGSGKSTLLRIICQLEKADSFEGFSCKGKVCMMFQNYALFPHLNVSENIAFALYKMPRHAKQARLEELLKTFKIEELKDQRIDQISGGQAQRVAFARAMASGCDLLLLDEPFSNLDKSLKEKLREELKDMIKQSSISVIMVTHDINDAYYLSDHIALLSGGQFIDYNSPEKLFFTPKSSQSASLIEYLNIIDFKKQDLSQIPIQDKEFFSWLEKKNGIFAMNELKLGGKFKGEIVEKSFCGSFYKLKIAFYELEFFMLVNSLEKIAEEEFSFEIRN